MQKDDVEATTARLSAFFDSVPEGKKDAIAQELAEILRVTRGTIYRRRNRQRKMQPIVTPLVNMALDMLASRMKKPEK